VSQQVEVSVPIDSLLKESSASIGDTLTETRVLELPLVGENVLDMMRLMPGMKAGQFTASGFADTDSSPASMRIQ
jgi:hypothetical protein